MDKIKSVGAILVTLIAGGLAVWWLALVAQRLGVRPIVENGNVILDEFQRSKDILLVVMPLFSAAVAYWVGSREAKEAKEEASASKEQLVAVLDQGPADLLRRAKTAYPEAFSTRHQDLPTPGPS